MTDNYDSFVQRWFILPKLLYFWLSMAIYSANGSFGNLLKHTWKFPNSRIGFIFALQGINFIGAIVWTGLADRTGKQKLLLAGATLMSAVVFAIHNLPKIMGITWSNPYYSLIYSICTMAISWFFQSAMFPLVDSSVIALLSKNPKFTKDQFSNQRLFGTPGHVVGNLLGAFLQSFGTKSVFFYTINAFTCASIFIALVMLTVPNGADAGAAKGHHHGHHEKKAETSVAVSGGMEKKDERSPVVRLLTDPVFMFFMLFVTSAGLLANTMTIYQQIFVSERKAALAAKAGEKTASVFSPTVIAALTRFSAAVSEITVYLTSKALTRALGFHWLLLFSQFAGIFRIFGYAIIEEATYTPFLLEILKGMNSGFIVSAGVRIASDIAPAGCSSSAQGLFAGNYKGISTMLTGVLCGIILICVGEDLSKMFYIIGGISCLTTIGFFIKFLFVDRVIGLPGFPRKERTPVMKEGPTTVKA